MYTYTTYTAAATVPMTVDDDCRQTFYDQDDRIGPNNSVSYGLFRVDKIVFARVGRPTASAAAAASSMVRGRLCVAHRTARLRAYSFIINTTRGGGGGGVIGCRGGNEQHTALPGVPSSSAAAGGPSSSSSTVTAAAAVPS